MKKILLYVAMLAILISPVISLASTVAVSTAGNYVVGHTYIVDVVVNPQTSKIYTSKVVVNFPSDLLQVKNFTFASGWLALSQPGYDSTDNVNGVLIKTGGYAGGLTAPATLGTITFYATKTGSGSITLGGDTQLLDANNQNVFTSTPGVSVVVNNAPAVTSGTVPGAVVSTVPDNSTVASSSASPATGANANQNAAAVGATGDNTATWWFVGIAAVVVLLVGGLLVYRNRKSV